MNATATILSLSELESFDPQAPARFGRQERRFLCHLPACAGKRPDAAHRSLAVDTATGAYHCHRCGASGLLREWHTDRPPISRRERARRELRRLTALPSPKQASTSPLAGRSPDRAGDSQAAPAERAAQGAAWREQLRGLRPGVARDFPGSGPQGGRAILRWWSRRVDSVMAKTEALRRR